MIKFSILITTKNRLEALKSTLKSISHLIDSSDVETIICNDGSKDKTTDFIKTNYPKIKLINNQKSKGLIFSRNRMLHQTTAEYAICLDDDAHIVSTYTLELISNFFKANERCAVMAFRIFWGETLPQCIDYTDTNTRVKGFVGCGHVWRMEAWKSIPDYPDWFVFYGEEEFASYQLFKNNWEVWYVPDILIHHRVYLKGRKKHKDYRVRLRRSLRSGWYLYFLFYPITTIPRRFLYTLWVQIRTKVLKGDFKAFLAIVQATGDLVINSPRLISNANRLSKKEFLDYSKLADTKLYWRPEDS
ncbi:glycosyltransferase family 2 protein [Tamlana fucoidanivorans]|uniref:Glycosyltransferase family 2 protein n=1 Tax=Allotamlana fucoidanivorans TaxID=2583814 RepID=A0A5C4SPF3_9FLAO|nr:glycosyltransferase family A protein [Tamlana fucoidanivorans]TNJ45760.1 glycosyltransferase family 2 protein [Tamlana fucoidanivorans]